LHGNVRKCYHPFIPYFIIAGAKVQIFSVIPYSFASFFKHTALPEHIIRVPRDMLRHARFCLSACPYISFRFPKDIKRRNKVNKIVEQSY
jgi:hypothetical protein